MKNRVWPSGGELVSSRSAGMKLPPTLFSTMTVVRRLSLIFCATSRAMTSVAPPADRPTSMRIGLPESSCAGAGIGLDASSAAPVSSASAHPVTRDVMPSSLVLLFGQQRRHDALARQWQIADALAERAATALPIAAPVGPTEASPSPSAGSFGA